MLPFYLLSLPKPIHLLQIVSIILHQIYHHQHHIDVYVWSFPKSISKSFFTYDTMAERPLGSFVSLKFCGFWGAMPQTPSFTYFLSVAATYFQFRFLNYV